jgi:acyl-CoA dehydrogenase
MWRCNLAQRGLAMSVLYDESQIAIGEEARRVVAGVTSKEKLLALLESRGAYDDAFWRTACEQGWAGITIAEQYGGLGLGLLELGIVALAVGRGSAGAPFLTTSYGASDAIARHGQESLKREWLPRLSAGDVIGAVAFAELGATLPAESSLSYAAGKVSGLKPAVAAGAHAHVVVVLAQDGAEQVLAAVTDMGNVSRQTLSTFDNSRCTANLEFEDSTAHVLVRGAAARSAALEILARQAIVVAHEQAGGAEALMTIARDYAVQRKAFGQVIGAFQSVKHRIAEIYALVQLARANAMHAASLADTSDLVKAAAAARLLSTEAYDTAARDCIQVHGGIGVTWEAGLHLHQRRARSLAVEQGACLFWEDALVERLIEENAA